MMNTPILQIENLTTAFDTDAGRMTAVDGVSFKVPRGETVGIVGESGCGKSVTAFSITRLLPQPRHLHVMDHRLVQSQAPLRTL